MTIRRICIVAILIALGACSPSPPPERKPQRAGEPVPVAETAARMAKARVAAVTGDREAMRKEIDGMSKDMLRSMKVPDPARRIDREAARNAARTVAGVRSAVWIDASNLMVMVSSHQDRSEAMIDAICLKLEQLGDTLAVVVNLQNAAARNGDEAETLSRNCQLQTGDRAFLQAKRQVDVLSPELRAKVQAQQRDASEDAERDRRAEEAAKILKLNTRELGARRE